MFHSCQTGRRTWTTTLHPPFRAQLTRIYSTSIALQNDAGKKLGFAKSTYSINIWREGEGAMTYVSKEASERASNGRQ